MAFGKDPSGIPALLLKRVESRARISSPPIELKPISGTVEPGYEYSGDGKKDSGGRAVGRRVMIVVDTRSEAKGALKWALSHAVMSQDTVVLLQVVKPKKHGDESQMDREPRGYKLLCAMKNVCQAMKPEVQVELSQVEGKERGPTIVTEAKNQGISLLVLGQKKRSVAWCMLMMWAGNRIRGDGMVDYCVQNATCMTLAVRRKGRRANGYLITTRSQKDFWLLA